MMSLNPVRRTSTASAALEELRSRSAARRRDRAVQRAVRRWMSGR